MYQYIYDSFLADSEYSKILTIIENRLTDLGLGGRIDRLTLFKDPREIIADGMKRGTKTVVVVGNDATLNQVINTLGELNLTVGMIPIGPQNEIAKVLGIPLGIASCDCLSNRLIQKIDLGKINDFYFLSHLKTSSAEISLRCGGKYCIRSVISNQVEIYNLPTSDETANPQDGYLEARIKPARGNFLKEAMRINFGFLMGPRQHQASFFPIKKIFLESKKENSILVDGLRTVNTPAEVQILPQRLKIIVGKNRLF